MERLDKAGIFYVGAGLSEKEAYSPKVITVGGAKVAFLAYSNLGAKSWAAQGDSSGIAWLDQAGLEAGIKEAKTRADLVVVMFHLGEEYKQHPIPNRKISLVWRSIQAPILWSGTIRTWRRKWKNIKVNTSLILWAILSLTRIFPKKRWRGWFWKLP